MINHSLIKQLLPHSVIKYLRAKRRRYLATKLKKQKQKVINQYGTFKSKELHSLLKQLNIEKGDCLFVQCSFNDMHTYSDSPIDLLNCLKKTIGETGTLFFPSYTDVSKFKNNHPINLKTVPTYTGIVNEIFRRSTNVIRSNHPRHSICGFGPLANEILKDHQKCQYADGKDSPFDRMRKLENAKILTLGLPDCYMSFLHWIEDIDPTRLPFQTHKKNPKKHELLLADGSLTTVNDFEINKSIVTLSLPLTCKKLSSKSMVLNSHKGISINVYTMKALAKELLELREQGVIHYKQEQ